VKITFLGTGTSQGVPVIACPCPICHSADERDKRLRTSVLIEAGRLNLVIDSGPDFRQQMLRADVQRLDALLFTHEHKDHIAGMDDIRAFNYVQQLPMPVYAERRVQEVIRREFSYVFAEEKYPGVPEVEFFTLENKEFHIGDQSIVPIRGMHLKLPVFGFRINNFAYLTDINFISDEEKEKIKDIDYLVVNGLRREKHISHYSLDEAIELIQEVNAREGFITHISHQMGFHSDIQKHLPPHIHLAYDGLSIETDNHNLSFPVI
jgi:phosphoribosyl 1,2-cyclic phosphate phosphodiesterase